MNDDTNLKEESTEVVFDDTTTEIDEVKIVPTTINTKAPLVKPNWIKVVDGKFICSECENEVEPETNTPDGIIKAHIEDVKADLIEFPTKVIYGICPICGMEFKFKLADKDLYLEPSDLEK